ncbi:MAG: tandem-95 repeat protein [Microcoleus sp. SM1_3_4]|nr:tandem-95 repeat protein [Microcoleus sp. SM1_3_4]
MAVAKVEVTVDRNRAPIASGDAAMVNAGSSVNINVLANDRDPDGDPLNLSIFKTSDNAKVGVNNNGTPDNPQDDIITYTPNANYSGDDIFLYQIDDGKGGSDVTKVEVTVKANQPPIASGDAASVNAGGSIDINVLANDRDADGDSLSLSIFREAHNGKAAVNNNGTPDNPQDDLITYTPNANYSGDDIFLYQIDDGKGGSDVTKVEVTVKAVNRLPIAIDDRATSHGDTSVKIPVLANDSDPDGDTLILTVLTNGVGGKAEINFNGTFEKTDDFITYQPHGDFIGSDSFTYQLDDSHGGTATATVNITVNPTNPAPLVLNGTPDPDTLMGAEGDDTINGDGADDLIYGEGGNDFLNGDLGNLDRIFGGIGDDTITDTDGVNEVRGDVGNDSINLTFAEIWDDNINPQ